jgi:hypothetical protein
MLMTFLPAMVPAWRGFWMRRQLARCGLVVGRYQQTGDADTPPTRISELCRNDKRECERHGGEISANGKFLRHYGDMARSKEHVGSAIECYQGIASKKLRDLPGDNLPSGRQEAKTTDTTRSPSLSTIKSAVVTRASEDGFPSEKSVWDSA